MCCGGSHRTWHSTCNGPITNREGREKGRIGTVASGKQCGFSVSDRDDKRWGVHTDAPDEGCAARLQKQHASVRAVQQGFRSNWGSSSRHNATTTTPQPQRQPTVLRNRARNRGSILQTAAAQHDKTRDNAMRAKGQNRDSTTHSTASSVRDNTSNRKDVPPR
eukprot:3928781-Rhodomonas_salina.1